MVIKQLLTYQVISSAQKIKSIETDSRIYATAKISNVETCKPLLRN